MQPAGPTSRQKTLAGTSLVLPAQSHTRKVLVVSERQRANGWAVDRPRYYVQIRGKSLPPKFGPGDEFWRQLILILVLALWVAVLIAGVAIKWNGSSTLSIWEHFTNIAWCFQAFVYGLMLAVCIVRLVFEAGCCVARCGAETYTETIYYMDTFVAWLWWPIYATAWVVYVVVFVIIGRSPGLITHQLKIYGGKYEINTIILGNELYHSLPVIANCFIALLLFPDLTRAAFTLRYRATPLYRRLALTWGIFGAPASMLFIYLLAVDYQKVYGTDLSVGILVVIALVVLLFTTVLPVLSIWTMLPYLPARVYATDKHIGEIAENSAELVRAASAQAAGRTK